MKTYRLLQWLSGRWSRQTNRQRFQSPRAQYRPAVLLLESRLAPAAQAFAWSDFLATARAFSRDEVAGWIGDRSFVPGEVVVALRSAAGAGELAAPLPLRGASSLGWTTGPDGSAVPLLHLQLMPETDTLTAVGQLWGWSEVLWVAPNFVYQGPDARDLTPNDPQYGSQYHHPLMQNNLAWDITTGSPSIIVAVTDDGFDIDHVDLNDNIWVNTGEIAANGVDDDGNGFIDDVNGWDFSSNDNNPRPEFGDAHGTHVAGIVAAEINNATGVAGTAGNVTIMPIRFYGSGAWTSTVIFNSYKYATDNGAQIISTSYNIDGFVSDPTFLAAINYAYSNGVLHFNSAGNNSELNPPRQVFDQLIFVASTESTDLKSGFSNYGFGIDVAAPGGSIRSTLPGNTYGLNSGTSMATPNAAAVAALIWSQHPTWTRDQVIAQLLGTTDNLNALNPSLAGLLGSGRVNSFKALSQPLAPPRIRDVLGLPANGGAQLPGSLNLSVVLDHVFDEASIENAANWELRRAGPDQVFGTGDDVLVSLTRQTNYMVGTNRVVFTTAALPAGLYQFRARAGGLEDPFGQDLDGDRDGLGGDDLVRTFRLNTAPTLSTSGNPALPAVVDGDLDPPGATVAALVGSAIADLDPGALQGFAVVGTTGQGSWQFSTDAGSSWTPLGSVSNATARLLLLTDGIRFVPTSPFTGSATLSLRAWDQTSGSPGGLGNATVNGGATAFSAAVESVAAPVLEVNHAPILNTSNTRTLPAIAEDTAAPLGTTVNSLVGSTISDPNTGALKGIAVVGSTGTGNGTWQVSTSGGFSWTALGTVTEGSARLLRANDLVRFVPSADFHGVATISYRAWDQTSGNIGQLADSTVNGGQTAFSIGIGSASLTVTPVNDAPVLDPDVNPTLSPIPWNITDPAGDTFAALLTGSHDIDGPDLGGVALTNLLGSGTWQFRQAEGGAWVSIGAVSPEAARLFRGTDFVRFVPSAGYLGLVKLRFHAWDQTSGTYYTSVDLTKFGATGGTTAFGTQQGEGVLSVAKSLKTIAEDTKKPAGNKVSAILGPTLALVQQAPVKGIAVVGPTATDKGTWQFSINGGKTWRPVGAVSETAALLLRTTDQVRFVPAPHFHGTATIHYHAWDRSVGKAGSLFNLTTAGTGFSAATDMSIVTVLSVNDRPVLNTAPNVVLTPVQNTDPNPMGDLVSSLLAGAVTDVDTAALQGIAVVAANAKGIGVWEFSVNGGVSWLELAPVSGTKAKLLRAQDRLRFRPLAGLGGTATLSYRAWDQTSGFAGSLVAPSGTAFSLATEMATVTVL